MGGVQVMRFDGYDLNMAGVVLAAGSTLLFVKAYLFPSFPEQSATTFLGANPFQVRNAIVQRRETTAGAAWLVASLLAFLLGYAWIAHGGEIGFLFGPFLDALLVLAVGVIALWITVAITKRLSRRAYLPRMIEMQRELFEHASFVISHGGLYRQEVEVKDAAQPSAGTRQKRLADASESLDQIGKLTDIPQRLGEADSEYLWRLRRLFQSAPARPTVE